VKIGEGYINQKDKKSEICNRTKRVG